jgi:glyoxylase-like metal-dependent hydrolase (beta-lactamase superfamily II)
MQTTFEVKTLDLGFQGVSQVIAAFLVRGPQGAILVETGPTSTLPALLAALEAEGLAPGDIGHVFVTHIHLDHAGAAGWWASQGARLYVHEVGAPHLVDPSRLLVSAARVYGGFLEALFGPMAPAPAEQVIPLRDGETVNVAGLTLVAVDTPGHAWHHHAYRLEEVAFVGDAAGVRLPGGRWITAPAPPPEFHLETWQNSLDRLRRERFSRLYLTHFGPVDDPDEHIEQLRQHLEAAAAQVRQGLRAGRSRHQILKAFLAWLQEQLAERGSPIEELQRHEVVIPTAMSVDGLMRYWLKREGG